MKLMNCEDCRDIVAPNPSDFTVRWCLCGRHAVWWEDGSRGKLVLYDKTERRYSPDSTYHGFLMQGPRAYVIGIHNAFLSGPPLTREQERALVEAADGYLFKTRGSLVIKIRPLESGDTRWSYELPGENHDSRG